MKFCVIDANNLAHRMKHAVRDTSDPSLCVGMILDRVFNAMKRAFLQFEATHMVVCFDSYSWRKEVYPEYKLRPRTEETESDMILRDAVKETLNELRAFLEECTNVTVLEHWGMEADDFIGRWVTLHDKPEFSNVIISSDRDFRQLVGERTELYDPLFNVLYTVDGVFIQDGKRARKNTEYVRKYGEDWKVKMTKVKKKVPLFDEFHEPITYKSGKQKTETIEVLEPEICDPEWELFYKCIRGDVSDNIHKSYPGVQDKRMREVFAKRGSVEWNAFMNETWPKDSDNPNVVKDKYEFNKLLIDLKNIPEEIMAVIDETIQEQFDKPLKRMVVRHFSKFCMKHDLPKPLKQLEVYGRVLSQPYL